MAERSEVPISAPEAKLERALIEEFLQRQGYSYGDLASLPRERRLQLLCDADLYAAGRMAEIEARAHYVEDLHRHE
jgi:hypothetical protein